MAEVWESVNPTYCSNDSTSITFAEVVPAKNKQDAVNYFSREKFDRCKRYHAKRVKIPGFVISLEQKVSDDLITKLKGKLGVGF